MPLRSLRNCCLSLTLLLPLLLSLHPGANNTHHPLLVQAHPQPDSRPPPFQHPYDAERDHDLAIPSLRHLREIGVPQPGRGAAGAAVSDAGLAALSTSAGPPATTTTTTTTTRRVVSTRTTTLVATKTNRPTAAALIPSGDDVSEEEEDDDDDDDEDEDEDEATRAWEEWDRRQRWMGGFVGRGSGRGWKGKEMGRGRAVNAVDPEKDPVAVTVVDVWKDEV